MVLPYGEIPMTLISVCMPIFCSFQTANEIYITGWVKEQSLSGIVGWFDYWLSQPENA